jgi:hypothetical protein
MYTRHFAVIPAINRFAALKRLAQPTDARLARLPPYLHDVEAARGVGIEQVQVQLSAPAQASLFAFVYRLARQGIFYMMARFDLHEQYHVAVLGDNIHFAVRASPIPL